jgi:hypothetical protein
MSVTRKNHKLSFFDTQSVAPINAGFNAEKKWVHSFISQYDEPTVTFHSFGSNAPGRTVENAQYVCNNLMYQFTLFIPEGKSVDVTFKLTEGKDKKEIDTFKWEKVTVEQAQKQLQELMPRIIEQTNQKKTKPKLINRYHFRESTLAKGHCDSNIEQNLSKKMKLK